MRNYEDYMNNQPMTDGEEIRSFFDDDEDESEESEMDEYIISTDIELTDIQKTVGVLNEKLAHWKKNYPYAAYEINQMEVALEVLNDLENDVANMDESEV